MTIAPLRNYLICGASSGIGLAIVEQILKHQQPNLIFATHREGKDRSLLKLQNSFPTKLVLFELEAKDETSYEKLNRLILQHCSHIDLVINSIGTLHHPSGQAPERKLSEFSKKEHLDVYEINTLPTILIAQALEKLLLNSEQPSFASISAKVGSISDNRMGGWYSYRISKAALNMVIKNLSIEFARKKKSAIFTAIHPGTTESQLSKPFIESARKKYQIHKPEQTAKNILNVINNMSPKTANGRFFSWDGQELPW